MMPRVFKLSPAYEDLDHHTSYLTREAGPKVAVRFLQAAERAFCMLAAMPTLGGCCEFSNPRLAHVRSFRIREYRNYIIFYRPIDGGIEVLRDLHGAQDAKRIFES
jgi:toxin ParE1/3/4